MNRRSFLTGVVGGLIVANTRTVSVAADAGAPVDSGYTTAAGLAEAIRRKRISARELLNATFQPGIGACRSVADLLPDA
jgi:hypothetical protein